MPENNVHDKVFTCPRCHNRTLYPIDEVGVIGIGYGAICICDECGAELAADPQYDFTVNFHDIDEEGQLITL